MNEKFWITKNVSDIKVIKNKGNIFVYSVKRIRKFAVSFLLNSGINFIVIRLECYVRLLYEETTINFLS